MYTPKHFQQHDPEAMKEFIRQNGFGVMVNQAEGKLVATHIPMLLSVTGDTLSGHIAKGNKQWKGFQSDVEVLCIFSGAHAYISSSWYDHENVPTWNYIAVHVYGVVRIVDGDELYHSLKSLMDKYEQTSEHPATIESLSPNYLKKEMLGIVGFEVAITKMESTYKLSQNRDNKNYQSVVTHLEKSNDTNSTKIASVMKKIRTT